jgi:hypothetical protein
MSFSASNVDIMPNIFIYEASQIFLKLSERAIIILKTSRLPSVCIGLNLNLKRVTT